MFLGIDIGTSGVKAVVLDEHGAVVGQGTAALTVQRPHPLWSEQDPEAWWQATIAAVRAIDPAVRRAVRGIGCRADARRHAAGADDQVLRPGILWNDGRSEPNARNWRPRPPISTGSRQPAMPGFTAPKLLWVQHHEPETFEKSVPCCCPRIMSGCA